MKLTPGQVRLLRLLAAGVAIVDPMPPSRRFQLYLPLGTRPAGVVAAKSVRELEACGCIERTPKGRWQVTDHGRAIAEVGTFVREFARMEAAH